MTTAVYAGSFDPPTLGHLDIIERASSVVSRLFVGVGTNSAKSTLFSYDERAAMLQTAISQRDMLSNRDVRVCVFQKELLVHFAQRVGATVIIRGIRDVQDLSFETVLAQANMTQDAKIETVFMLTDPRYGFVSSSAVKEIARYGGNCADFVDRAVEIALFEKLGVPFRQSA